MPREGANVIAILRKYIVIIGLKKRSGFLPLLGEGGPIHERVDWDGRGDFEDQLVFLAGSLPTFAPEKGPKATFPYQGKEQKLLLY
ncbi:hypothetical protein [Arenibacter palladensis]|uniref:hypothetical protein n=1 Tax=Arenibacter palladensis TaxID=237373 RepID=UPI0026E1B3ED|nr:hypothetical protein [Arenibacter palladensis]MDO6604902.1 hypothetical protein [Arenibacter palladensis]